jgi:biofilm PGA synthesis lipoprotein PgaB
MRLYAFKDDDNEHTFFREPDTHRLALPQRKCLRAGISFIAPKDRPQLEASKPWPQNQFLVLAYHDVEDDAADQRYLSVRTSALNEQISWLLHNGYHVISVQDILDAHDGKNAAAQSRSAQL